MTNLQVFSGSRNEAFTELVALAAGAEDGDFMRSRSSIYHHTFPSGECYCQLKNNVRGSDVFFIQSLSNPVNDNLMELMIMIDAARRASAERITAVIPYFGYSRQDRKDKPRVPISAKVVMDMLSGVGVSRILTMDLHAAQIVGMTNLPVDHLSFESTLLPYLRGDVVIVAPDQGATKRAEAYARKKKCDLAFISKTRKDDTTVEVSSFVGNVKDKHAIIIDDLTESCGTLIQAAQLCKDKGAIKVSCAVTHFAITEVGIERLNAALKANIIDTFFHSNTIVNPLKSLLPTNVIEIGVQNLFGDAIKRIHNNESISELY